MDSKEPKTASSEAGCDEHLATCVNSPPSRKVLSWKITQISRSVRIQPKLIGNLTLIPGLSSDHYLRTDLVWSVTWKWQSFMWVRSPFCDSLDFTSINADGAGGYLLDCQKSHQVRHLIELLQTIQINSAQLTSSDLEFSCCYWSTWLRSKAN